jgi:hypothetical protein
MTSDDSFSSPDEAFRGQFVDRLGKLDPDDWGFWGSLKRAVLDCPPVVGWRRVVELAEATDDPGLLSMLGVVVAEPLLQMHWETLTPLLAETARQHPNLRTVVHSVMVSDVPREFDDLLDRITHGHGSTT